MGAAPALEALDVSGNRLAMPTKGDDVALAPLAQLTALAANGVGLKGWAQALRLGAAAPKLEVLHARRGAETRPRRASQP